MAAPVVEQKRIRNRAGWGVEDLITFYVCNICGQGFYKIHDGDSPFPAVYRCALIGWWGPRSFPLHRTASPRSGTMFWKFDLHTTSHIDTLLEKEDVTLTEVMDEEDVLQECKAQNRKLVDFLVRPQCMEDLVSYITQEPCDDMDEKIKYKYPNISCELLTSDVGQVNDRLGEDENLLMKLYSFLQNEPPLNPLLASFFSKVLSILISRKPDQIVEFLRKREDFVDLMIKHMFSWTSCSAC
ncbi:hypothetical protein COCON_G00218260 [Conger conger]|uniref:Uncharacterized protein n=1 Tax=Conger conger TaxID=82655 RepID=A0A9Q1HNT4_CONCO|nr:hypothetical protein COCON_G00218260 [Conger conger]